MTFVKNIRLFPALIVLMRFLFGIGWLLAGVTKLTEKSWFKEPGLFLREYLMASLQNSNVPIFYKIFVENVVLEHVMIFNYVIPIAQIILGLFLIVGLFTIPSILICLFMHINFILSGNMNVISLILYTNAFSLIIFRKSIYYFSLDKYFNLETLFGINLNKRETTASSPSKKENLLSNS
ncbi:DoxX family membrane protein [Alkalihalobacillus deserti]|uniref:DoxX family membrane protein n=1 Tax=Alkalihalobacillus deserti TaxID=2879466 RepID=UPI001D153544|nr:DoxX family membrane protein [Alkalihalobacillus deserti]